MSAKQTETVDAVLEDVSALRVALDRVLDDRQISRCETAPELQASLTTVEQRLTEALDLAQDLRRRADQIGLRDPAQSAKPPKKICRRCTLAKRGASWTCRSCGAACCEHLCGFKSMSGGADRPTIAHATCGTCQR